MVEGDARDAEQTASASSEQETRVARGRGLPRILRTVGMYLLLGLTLLPGVDWVVSAREFRERDEPWGSSWDGCFLVLGFFVSVVPLVAVVVWWIARAT